MRLISFQVTNYKSIDDSRVVAVEPDVTCLVGKNESGKTAILQALRRIAPHDGARVDHIIDYPRRRVNQYRQRHEQQPDPVVAAEFELDANDVAAVEAAHGKGVLRRPWLRVTVTYANAIEVALDIDEAVFVEALVAGVVPAESLEAVRGASRSLAELVAHLAGVPDATPGAAPLRQKVAGIKGPVCTWIWEQTLKARLPTFLYFDDYSVMAGAASLDLIAEAEQNRGKPNADRALSALADLLHLAGVKAQDLKPDGLAYEDHKARLEATANDITDEAFRFWSQNRDLEVEIDVSPTGKDDPPRAKGPQNLRLRVKNRRHRATVPFDDRSRGFVWFFSFLAVFKRLAAEGRPLIILLDEPGMSLHASAQGDFLRFIDERLAPTCQVIFSTHSPFMIDPRKLNRARIVEDVDSKGTEVSSEVLRARDPATQFPLQHALGYTLSQTLFVGPHCLLVEGPSDLLYLQAMSAALAGAGQRGLDPRWVITPVGGADRLATFVTLLGTNDINVVALVDVEKKNEQRLRALDRDPHLGGGRLVKVSEFTAAVTDADIEDLFEPEEYVAFVAAAYPAAKDLTVGDLPPGTRIVDRVKRALDGRGVSFNHYQPSLAAVPAIAKGPMSDATVGRFTALLDRVNAFIPA